MAILFLLALILAWPTYGLSIIGWLALSFMRAKGKIDRINDRVERRALIEPVFEGKFAEFYRALEVPQHSHASLQNDDAERCGRHIMNYLAHNPSEWALFYKGLRRWRRNGSDALADPATVARLESVNGRAEVHLVSFRAVEALISNNLDLSCFVSTDYEKLAQQRAWLES